MDGPYFNEFGTIIRTLMIQARKQLFGCWLLHLYSILDPSSAGNTSNPGDDHPVGVTSAR